MRTDTARLLVKLLLTDNQDPQDILHNRLDPATAAALETLIAIAGQHTRPKRSRPRKKGEPLQ